MRHLTASIPTASTRTLVAAFMAAAFTLLVLLPAFGQSTFDRTDGRMSSGSGLSVGVFDDIEDAQLEKNQRTTYEDGTIVYLPEDNPQAYLGTRGTVSVFDTAYLADGQTSPQQTFFGGTLYASNNPVNDEYDTNGVRTAGEGAYNTILIAAESDRVTLPADSTCAVATVRNGRSNGSITVQMAGTSQTDGTTYYQAFVRILDSRAEDAQGTLLYTSSDGPDCVQDTSVTPIPPNYGTGVDQDATASILARHGDRITIDVEGAGTVSVEVDGEGPDISGITPET